MGKKNTDIIVGNTEETTLEATPEIKEVAPIAKEETTPLLSGYIQIKLIGKESNGIVIKANQFGTTYPKDKWEIVATKKK